MQNELLFVETRPDVEHPCRNLVPLFRLYSGVGIVDESDIGNDVVCYSGINRVCSYFQSVQWMFTLTLNLQE